MPKPRPGDDYTKTCSLCGEPKTAQHFHSAPTARDGLQSRCKECQNKLNAAARAADPEKNRERCRDWQKRQTKEAKAARARKWRENNPERARDHMLKKNRGLPLGTYGKMLAAQDGRCAICGTDRPGGMGRFHVDHCHDTETIRGLLCHHCNLLLGHAKNSEVILGSAIDYLKSSRR